MRKNTPPCGPGRWRLVWLAAGLLLCVAPAGSDIASGVHTESTPAHAFHGDIIRYWERQGWGTPTVEARLQLCEVSGSVGFDRMSELSVACQDEFGANDTLIVLINGWLGFERKASFLGPIDFWNAYLMGEQRFVAVVHNSNHAVLAWGAHRQRSIFAREDHQHWAETPFQEAEYMNVFRAKAPKSLGCTHQLHALLRKLAQRKSDIFYLQIGAFDGVQWDPIFPMPFELNFWSLLVEPQRNVFAQLQRNYRGHPRVQFANVAVCNYTGPARIFVPPPGRRMESDEQASAHLADEHETVVKNHVDLCRKHQLPGTPADRCVAAAESFVATDIMCITLEELLTDFQVTHIDVLQIDAEGKDWSIFQQLNMTRFRPSVIQMEWTTLLVDDRAEERLAAEERLRALGYSSSRWGSGQDLLLVHESFSDAEQEFASSKCQ